MNKNHKNTVSVLYIKGFSETVRRNNSKYKIVCVLYKIISICVIPQARWKLLFGIKLNILGSDKSHSKAKSKTCKVHDVLEILRLLSD